MTRNRWYIWVLDHHLVLEGSMQLHYKILVFMLFYAMVMFQFELILLSSNAFPGVMMVMIWKFLFKYLGRNGKDKRKKKKKYHTNWFGSHWSICTFNITIVSLYYRISHRPSCCIFELILWQLPMKAALIFPWNIHQAIIAWSSIIQTPSDKLVYFICMVITLMCPSYM